jgi:hypothetical protein
MTAHESAAAESFREPSSSDIASTLEGLELVQAFMRINAAADRQKIIELAKQLSTPGRVGPDTELRAGKKIRLNYQV